MVSPSAPSTQRLRSFFPSLKSGTIFFENAGGSQVPIQVAKRAYDYVLNSYVNTGAGYPESQAATQNLRDAHAFVNRLMGGEGVGNVAFGASTSQLLRMLADAKLDILKPGDQIVIAETGHEANINPWVRLEKFGIEMVWWKVDRDAQQCTIEGLKPLLNERTRLVVFPQASNLLGEVVDVPAITKLVHEAGAEVVVDGVAYAPHDLMSVADWGVDWYIYSTYKVFGPHMAALWGRTEAWVPLDGPNHFFIPRESFPYKFELGCQNHEGAAAILGLGDYMLDAIGESANGLPSRTQIEAAWKHFNACEAPLTPRLLDFLNSKTEVSIVGPKHAAPNRIGIVSFTHARHAPAEMAAKLEAARIGCRHGHAYAYRLCEGLGIDPKTGVLRVSFCHYNTLDEVDRLIENLDPML